MKTLFCCLLLLCACAAAQAQTAPAPLPDSVRAYLDKSLTLLETYALERGRVNWPQLRQRLIQQAQGARTIAELMPLYPAVFEQLNDDHGWLTHQGKTYKWRNPARRPYTNAVVKAELAKKPGIVVRLLPHGIGYLRLPGIEAGGSMAAQRAAAEIVRDSVCRLHPGKVRAWILDLRLNDGGAMAPMLGGIAPLLGDGHLGGFVDHAGQAQEQWYLKRGNFYLDTLGITALSGRGMEAKTNKPIAVLLSGRTASSGEIVAISLKGRPATRFFGEPTYGATTANTSYQVRGTSYLTIAGSFDCDRQGKVYHAGVAPDVAIVGGDNFADLTQDAKVTAALQWFATAKPSKPRKSGKLEKPAISKGKK